MVQARLTTTTRTPLKRGTVEVATIEHENKREETLTCLGQGAALEDGKWPHSDRGAWENAGPLQDAEGSAPNAKDPNEQYRQHGSLSENQRGAVGGE
jgi:hypothetical protein